MCVQEGRAGGTAEAVSLGKILSPVCVGGKRDGGYVWWAEHGRVDTGEGCDQGDRYHALCLCCARNGECMWIGYAWARKRLGQGGLGNCLVDTHAKMPVSACSDLHRI